MCQWDYRRWEGCRKDNWIGFPVCSERCAMKPKKVFVSDLFIMEMWEKQNKTKQKTLPCRIFVPGGRQKASGFCGEMIWRQRYNSSAVTFCCQPSMHPLSVAASCAPLLEGKEGMVLEPVPADTGGDAGCILHSQLVTGLASVHTMIPSVWNKKPNYSLAVFTNYEINFKPIIRLSLSSNRKRSQCWTIEHTIITWNRCLVPVQFLFFFCDVVCAVWPDAVVYFC